MDFELVEFDAVEKAKLILSKYQNISLSYSGGKDSEFLINLFSKYNLIKKYNIKIIFFDTGIEYEATKRFIDKKNNQGYKIIKVRAEKPVPLTIKQFGQPFISKRVSEMLERLQRHNFDFDNHIQLKYPKLEKMYPRCLSALRWLTNYYGSKYDTLENQKRYDRPNKSIGNIARNKWLREFLIKYGLHFKVSAKCCHYAKKSTINKFNKQNNIQLNILGIRKSEGGARAAAYKGCYIQREDVSLYLPIFWFNNENVQKFITINNIQLSDCYTTYGLERTGCAGCPFGRNLEKEREILKKYEPRLSKAVEYIFKDSYEYTKKYKEFCKKMNQREE